MSPQSLMLMVRRLPQRIWFRLVLFAAAAIAVALAGGVAAHLVPSLVDVDLGQDAVSTILQIIATSMLAVTTFSLAAMISAYSSAAASTTPRATQLLLEDRTSQNALSTFLGAFVFAIVGIAALSTGWYGDHGRIVLYLGALAVIAIVVVTLLRWIQHLVTFGRMADVLDRVETAACDAVVAAFRRPHLGGAPPVPVPAGTFPVDAGRTGVVTAVHVGALGRIAAAQDLRIHVCALPGAAVGSPTPLASIEGVTDADTRRRVREAFTIESHRTYEQDPRLGMVALAEIGSRALSTSVNDPGTAIEALNAIHRVLETALRTPAQEEEPQRRVHVPAVPLDDLLEDALRPIARDGAAVVEVGLRVQRVLAALVPLATTHDREALLQASARAEHRALAGLHDEPDARLIADAAARTREAGERRGGRHDDTGG